jgi:O-antigen/teichoic acid export membrane protein
MKHLIHALCSSAKQVANWGARKTHVDIAYVAKGGFWLTIGQAVATLTGFLVTVVLANLLTEEQYGSYKYILSLYGIIAVFSLSGMATAITRATAKGHEGVFRHGTRLTFLWGLGMTAFALVAGGYYLYKGNMLLGWSLGLIALFAPLLQSSALYFAYINGKRDYRTYTLFTILYSTLPPVALIVTALITTEVLWLVFVFLASETLVHVVQYWLTIRKYHPNNSMDGASTGYGKHLSLMNILGGVSFNLDKILVWQHLGAAPLALYAIATAPPQQLRYLSKILNTMALPRFSERSLEELQNTMRHKAILLFGISAGIVLVYVLLAPILYHVFFPKYEEAIIYSQVFSLLILFFPATLFQQALTAHMQKKQLYVLQTVIPLTKISILMILLPLFGIWGVLLTMFLAEILRLILVVYFFYHIKNART